MEESSVKSTTNACEVDERQIFGSFATHWRNLHDRFIKLFKCMGCGKRAFGCHQWTMAVIEFA